MPPDNNIDSNQEEEWHTPNWKPQPEKKPCDCEKRDLNPHYPQPSINLNHPDSPSAIRSGKKNTWASWEAWNDLEKKLKEAAHASSLKEDQVAGKTVKSQESSISEAETESVVPKTAENPAIRLLRKRI